MNNALVGIGQRLLKDMLKELKNWSEWTDEWEWTKLLIHRQSARFYAYNFSQGLNSGNFARDGC